MLHAPERPTRDSAGVKNMRQLIELRWYAVVGQVVTILVVHFGLGIRLPLEPMAIAVLFLCVFNIASLVRWRGRLEVPERALFVAMLMDVGTLTAQLYLSGGATNPFVFLFLLQVALGAMLLRPGSTWTIVGIATACFAALTVYHRPLATPARPDQAFTSPHTLGLLVCFVLIAALLVVFLTRIGRNLRARDARLADLRQRAAEEEHIVRMGLLASGAAHELGTPLATLAVILGDWRRMPVFTADPELLQEVGEMQTQVARCKTIVTGILLSAGEARGESPNATSVTAFLDELVAEWRTTRSPRALAYSNAFGDDVAIVSDSALKQTIYNVLDNALEASPRWVGLTASRAGDQLVLTVSDTGPGFAPEMLSRLGKPYQSSKGRPGGGLGLFLVTNVARTLGGSVAARNRPEGGAEVTLTLPLAAVQIDEETDHAG